MVSLSGDNQADVIDAFNLTIHVWLVKYTLQSSNLIKVIPLIQEPRFSLAFVHF